MNLLFSSAFVNLTLNILLMYFIACLYGMQLASDWEFVFVCTKDKVMNPVVNIQYAYPVISEYVQEELEFIFR